VVLSRVEDPKDAVGALDRFRLGPIIPRRVRGRPRTFTGTGSDKSPRLPARSARPPRPAAASRTVARMLTGSGLTGTARAAAVGAAADGERHAAPPPGDSRGIPRQPFRLALLREQLASTVTPAQYHRASLGGGARRRCVLDSRLVITCLHSTFMVSVTAAGLARYPLAPVRCGL
jgi:hypothetical protein